MKSNRIKSVILALALAFAGTPALAQDAGAAPAGAPPQASADMPSGAEQWAQMMWDFTRNPEVMKDPKAFVPWFSAATEPAFYAALGMQMLDPARWGQMANSMMDPRAYSAWMPLMSDPNVYMKWVTATVDPNFYTAVLAQLTDPGKMMRWAMAPLDPKMLNLALQSVNPAMYLKWMMAPLDPQWVRAMVTPLTPNVYIGWLGAMMNPGSYGEAWKAFLATPSQPIAPLAFPAPTVTPGSSSFNPFDPNSWAQGLAVPGASTAPGAAAPAMPFVFNPFDPNTWAQMWQLPYGGTAPAPAAAPRQ